MGCVFGKDSSSPKSTRSKRGNRNERSSVSKPNREKIERIQSPIKRVGLELEAKAVTLRNERGVSSTVNAAEVGVGVGVGGERAVTREEKSQVGNVSKRFVEKNIGKDEFVNRWPRWLVDNIPSDVLAGLVPRSADSYEMLAKVGHGTYSNVYKARDKNTGKIVALKKVRFDTSDSESIKFMAREIKILQMLDHPNVIKLEGLATSRMQCSLYLVFDFMQSDLTRIITRPRKRLTEAQIKCYMLQLLSGLRHCHERGVMHRDIKAPNLLIDKRGVLKIADFGIAYSISLKSKGPLTNRVGTLWYRAPELLLGSTDYGFDIDLWSAGCLLAEMFVGRPIMPGRTEIEQLHMIFKLCGSPPDDYWKNLKLMTSYQPPRHYKPNYEQAFQDFPSSSLGLLTMLLDLDPSRRGTAASALQSEFFYASPLACELSALPGIYKDEDERSQTIRHKKHRHRALRRGQSQTSNVRQSGKKQIAEQPRRGSESFKEDKSVEPKMHGQETGNSASSSSSASFSSEKEWLRTEGHPFAFSDQTDAHRNALKNFKNLNTLFQASTVDAINRKEENELGQLRRSFSALNLRLDPGKLSDLMDYLKVSAGERSVSHTSR